jgi:16S rRNA (guanine527-N7)-methyltransferase
MRSVRELRGIVDLTDGQVDQLERYLACLLHWNRRISLVSQKDPAVILDKHFADSLHAAETCRGAESLLDVGAGAGFPGLPISIARPDLQVTLVDSSRKKVSFLVDAIRAAGVGNARAVEARVPDLPAQNRRPYDLVICRALMTVGEFLPQVHRLVRPDGRVLMMKGPRYAREVSEASVHGYRPLPSREYRLPDGSHRIMLAFQRTSD